MHYSTPEDAPSLITRGRRQAHERLRRRVAVAGPKLMFTTAGRTVLVSAGKQEHPGIPSHPGPNDERSTEESNGCE
jgi:hypothetical protein